MQKLIITVIAFVMCWTHGSADTIYLEGGRKIEGVVLSEDATSVKIELAMGVVSYPRTKILRIDRDRLGDKRRNVLQQKKAFEPRLDALKKAISEVYRSDGRLKELQGRQNAIANSTQNRNKTVQKLRSRKAEVEGKLEPLKNYYGRLSKEIYDTQIQLEEEHRDVEDSLEKLQKDQEQADSRNARIAGLVSQAETTLKGKLNLLADRVKQLELDGCPAEFLERGKKAIAELSVQSSSKRGPIPLRKRGNSYFLYVSLNSKVTTEFILDTGCSTTLLSRSVFSRLDPSGVERQGNGKVSIADGSQVDVGIYRLDLVEIGGYQVRYMTVMVPRSNVTQEVPLLLGMSFLKHFKFTIDTAQNLLVLDRH